jgi:hypothetical protein
MSESKLSGDAVDALNKILDHAAENNGVVSISAMNSTSWSAIYLATGNESKAMAMHEDLDEVIIEVAKEAGLV